MKDSQSKIILCISFFLLAMLPLHYMPPIYANPVFLHSLLGSININLYLYSYLIGFILSGFVLLCRTSTYVSSKAVIISLFFCCSFSVLSMLLSGWATVACRLFAGIFGCLLYIRVYTLASESKDSKINLVGKILGITSIFLESSALLSGAISNLGIDWLIRSSYVVVTLCATIFAYAYMHNKEKSLSAYTTKKRYNRAIGNLSALFFMLPSVLCFTGFFIFLLNVGYAAKGLIEPFYIGFTVFLLAIAFPFGSFISGSVLRKLNYKLSIFLFSISALIGVPVQALGISESFWPLLSLGACLMAIGNGGIITTNSALSLDTFSNDPTRPTLLYMVIAMTVTTLFGVISYSISDKLVFSFLMFIIYCLVILSIIILPKRAILCD